MFQQGSAEPILYLICKVRGKNPTLSEALVIYSLCLLVAQQNKCAEYYCDKT